MIPSAELPTLSQQSTPEVILPHLEQLRLIYSPGFSVVDLTGDNTNLNEEILSENSSQTGNDGFELQFVKGWLNRAISLASKKAASVNNETDLESWSTILDSAAGLLANLSGPAASSGHTTQFLLPYPPAHFPQVPISLEIRETTLLADATGFRTWGAAPLLAQQIAHDLTHLMPDQADGTLRVLELGSGTGLVGLTAAAILSRLNRSSTITLSDFDEHVLDNLRHNVEANRAQLSECENHVIRLDWNQFSKEQEQENFPGSEHEFDLILAADVIYEAQHVHLILSTLTTLLSLAYDSHSSQITPTAIVMLPLRSTHEAEHSEFNKILSPESPALDKYTRKDSHGTRWRLATHSRFTLTGEDGFRSRGEKARYWKFVLYWVKVQIS